MAIKRSSKVETSFGSSAMTDMMFLLLIFFLVLTTLINTNALDILLPKSSNKIGDRTSVNMSVTQDLRYFINGEQVEFGEIENILNARVQEIDSPIVMLSIDKRVSVEEFAKIMDIAKKNGISLYMMTSQ